MAQWTQEKTPISSVYSEVYNLKLENKFDVRLAKLRNAKSEVWWVQSYSLWADNTHYPLYGSDNFTATEAKESALNFMYDKLGNKIIELNTFQNQILLHHTEN